MLSKEDLEGAMMEAFTKEEVERIAEWMRVRAQPVEEFVVLSTTYYDWVKAEFEHAGKEMPANFIRQVKLPKGVDPLATRNDAEEEGGW